MDVAALVGVVGRAGHRIGEVGVAACRDAGHLPLLLSPSLLSYLSS